MAITKKKITQKDINDCIELIEKMSVQVNYLDKKFVDEAGLTKVKLQNNERFGEKRRQYFFGDVISKISMKKRIELEDDYKKRKIRYALKANARLLNFIPDAKEQIVKAFVPFIDEIQQRLDFLIQNDFVDIAEKYLQKDSVSAEQFYEDEIAKRRFNRGLHLVYANMESRKAFYTDDIYDDWGEKLEVKGEALVYEKVPSDEEYSFSTLPNLLNVIAKITTEYCKEMDKLQGIDRTDITVGEAKRGQVTPLFIRQCCAWVCYTLLYFGDTLSKYFRQQPLSSQSGVCSQIMHDLHLRTKNSFNYEYFAKEKKLLEYNKWSILPEVILREGNFVAPVSPVNYAGHKSGYLGFMIQSLVDQRAFDTYLEPFGGSGIGITQFHKKDGVKYYISDGNYANICFYKTLISSNKDYKVFIEKLEKAQEKLREIYKNFDSYNYSKSQYERNIGKKYRNGYLPSSDYLNDFTEYARRKARKTKSKQVKQYQIFDISWYDDIDTDSATKTNMFNMTFNMLKSLCDVKRFYIKYYNLYDDVSNLFLNKKALKEYEKDEIDIAIDWKLDLFTLKVFEYLNCKTDEIKESILETIDKVYTQETNSGYSFEDKLKLQKELEKLENKRVRLLDVLTDGIISKETYKVKEGEISTDILSVQSKLSEIDKAQITANNKEKTLTAVRLFVENALSFPNVNEGVSLVPEKLVQVFVNSIKVCANNVFEYNIRVDKDAKVDSPLVVPDEEFIPSVHSATKKLDNSNAVLLGEFEVDYATAKDYANKLSRKVVRVHWNTPAKIKIYANIQ